MCPSTASAHDIVAMEVILAIVNQELLSRGDIALGLEYNGSTATDHHRPSVNVWSARMVEEPRHIASNLGVNMCYALYFENVETSYIVFGGEQLANILAYVLALRDHPAGLHVRAEPHLRSCVFDLDEIVQSPGRASKPFEITILPTLTRVGEIIADKAYELVGIL